MKEIVKKFLADKDYPCDVYICGDGMYDEYYEVDAERVSPEFPIPVMMSSTGEPNRVMPGGAANVANQFKYFKKNYNVSYCGYSDKDFNALLVRHDIDNKYFSFGGVEFPVKKRLYCNGFPLCRWDIETNSNKLLLESYKFDGLYKSLKKLKPGIMIFSDYDKGTFAYPNRWCEGLTLGHGGLNITIVDPKSEDIDKWYGCSIFKPNYKEAIKLSGGITDWKKQCDYFQERLKCQTVIITCGADGVVGKDFKEYFQYCPLDSVVAESVIGAGDCFVAFLAMTINCQLTMKECVMLAFEAGKRYVQNKYNQPIGPLDLLESIGEKQVDNLDIFSERSDKLVFANGVFDILHAGHIELLKWAKSRGDKLVVALNSDDSAKRLAKGPNRPVNILNNRIDLISSLECVDYVVSFDEDTPINQIKTIKPDLIVKGGDYKKEDVVGNELFQVEIFPTYKDLSSTKILNNASK